MVYSYTHSKGPRFYDVSFTFLSTNAGHLEIQINMPCHVDTRQEAMKMEKASIRKIQ
jgi:hypothetical protein